MKCPRCGDEAQELADEVDIGVGVQKRVYGCECPQCGQIGLCPYCGSWDFRPHLKWCEQVKNL